MLAEEEFPRKEKQLPKSLTSLPIEILWVLKNYKAFKKVAFTLRKYPEAVVCTADDDCIYDRNYAEELYNKWIEFGKQKCCIKYVDDPHICFLGPCMLYYGINFPVEGLTEYQINKSFDDTWMWKYAKANRIPILTCNKKEVPFKIHNDNDPLHPTFGSEIMQSIQHVDL